jgi:hypothetical protein
MNKNIRSQLETVEKVFVATHSTLDSMTDGQRIQLKELAKVVGLAVAMEPKRVLDFVNHFVHNTDVAYVTRGKNGGIVKGEKPVKVEKPKKASKKDAVVADDDSTDATV